MSEKEKKHKGHDKSHETCNAADAPADSARETVGSVGADASHGEAAVDGAPGVSENTDAGCGCAGNSPEAGESAAQSPSGGLQGEKEADAAGVSDKDRIAELEKQSDEYKDLYMRKAADFDNYRKRMIREKQEAVDFANANLLVDLIQVLDDFDRAISAAGEQEAGSASAAFVEGVQMIRRQMASMLESKYGLVYYPSVGEPFDPNIHEAIGRVPSEGVDEPVVQEECRKGYKLKDRVIRLAQVIVKTPPEN